MKLIFSSPCSPADLIQHLLEGPAGPSVGARCAAAAKIATLSGVDGTDVVLKLLRKWLRCAEDPMGGEDDDVVRNAPEVSLQTAFYSSYYLLGCYVCYLKKGTTVMHE